MPAPEDRTADELLDRRDPVRTGLLWLWAYAAASAVLALVAGDAVAGATGPVLPATATRYGTVAAVAVCAGLACEHVLTAVANAVHRR